VRLLVQSVLAATVGVAILAAAAPPASAHSFLATTRPAQGERLGSAPGDIALQLSEPVVREAVELTVVDGEGRPVEVGRPEFSDDDRVVRLPLVERRAGLHRTSWHVVSAVDGHESAGEFTFAVGDAAASVPGSRTSAGPRIPWWATAGTWVLLSGWSAAFGAALLARRSPAARFPGRPTTWTAVGSLVAVGGLALRWSATAPSEQLLVVAGTAAALLAAVAWSPTRSPWPSLGALVAVAPIWSARSHAAASGIFGWSLDTLHLLAAGVWLGGLLVVVAGVALHFRAGDAAAALPLARSYARIAAVAVATLALTGLASAAVLLPGSAALVESPYGQLLLVKTGVLAAAVGGAVLARRALRGSRTLGLRRATRPELLSLGAAVAVAAILVDLPPPAPDATELLLGPPPIEGPTARAAALAGLITVDVATGDGRLDVHLRGGSGGIDGQLELTATLPDGAGLELHPRPCGVGCWTLQLELPDGTTTVTATVSADDRDGGAVTLPLHWPPPAEQPQLFSDMLDEMRAVPTVEVLESQDGASMPSGGGARLRGAQFVDLMPWAGAGVTDVRPVPDDPGRFTFYLSGSTMWFDVTVDDRGRLLTQRLVNPGHDIRYELRYTDAEAGSGPQ
jgi:copper transport protein